MGERSSPPPLPQLDDIDFGSLAPVFGVKGNLPEPDYLDYDPKGRGLFEKMFFNTGVAFIAGSTLAGIYGLIEGARAAKGQRFRLKVNSILNASVRRGVRAGNAVGVLAVMYTTAEWLCDTVEVQEHTGQEWLPPVLAGATTGLVYKCTAGHKTALLASVLGAGVAGAGYAGSYMYHSLSSPTRK